MTVNAATLIAHDINPEYAQLVIDACEENDLPVEFACTLLHLETGKTASRRYHGNNIYGHDVDACMTVIGVDVEVTEHNFIAYLGCVATGKRNGVGPLQITHWSLQDACGPRLWDWRVSIPFGIRHFACLRKSYGNDRTAFLKWNGKESYADKAMGVLSTWTAILAKEGPMNDIWLPGYDKKPLGLHGGVYDETSNPKLCWHTTEGPSLAGAERAYANYPPHIGVNPTTGEKHQYVPLNKHSYALAGSESDDEYVIQVEVVGYAGQSHLWGDAVLRWLGENVVRPIRETIGVPDVVIPAGFRKEGGGIVLASKYSPIRLSLDGLRKFSGHLGHQHMPSPDSHWDPGGLPIHKILSFSQSATVSQPVKPKNRVSKESDPMYVTCHELARSAVNIGGKLIELNDSAERKRAQDQINAGTVVEIRLSANTFKRAMGEVS